MTIQIMRYVLLGCKKKRHHHQPGRAQPTVPAVLSAGSHHPMPAQCRATATLRGLLPKRAPECQGHRLWAGVKGGSATYQQPDGAFHLLQHLAGVGRDRAYPRAPQHREEPGLVHHVQVDRDVVLAVLPAGDSVLRAAGRGLPAHSLHSRRLCLGCDPAFAATAWRVRPRASLLARQSTADCSQLHPLRCACPTAAAHTLPFPAELIFTSAGFGAELEQCLGPTAPRLLGTGLSPDLLRAHVLVGQVDMQQWLLLVLESLPAVDLLNPWGLLFDLFPVPIGQPEDLGRSQKPRAEKRHPRELALLWYFLQ